ncbi:UDP-glucose 4-epimerase [Nakamurella flavida]|nr:NAD(P)-dependent oxidoreductase [Nakamurella flavida]MDP9777253.1 UDP-glucose 4-epimerase [Nakamurella flavida]
MILVTGGFGFIGSHVVRALHDQGVRTVVVQRGRAAVPEHLADLPVAVVRADVADLADLRAVGERHSVTGIVHLAGYPMPDGPEGRRTGIDPTQRWLQGLLNIGRVAQEWQVDRVGLASTIGVYFGTGHRGVLTEDLAVTLTAPHPIPRAKKITELLGEHLAETTGLDVVHYRISGTWGPLGHADPFFAAPALAHAAAAGTVPDLAALAGAPRLGDGLDLNYVKDTGRAIALLQLADRLRYRTYNVAAGRTTTNAEIITALRTIAPDADLALPDGGEAGDPMDITRLREDTGYAPRYGTVEAADDYVTWLRAGHLR